MAPLSAFTTAYISAGYILHMSVYVTYTEFRWGIKDWADVEALISLPEDRTFYIHYHINDTKKLNTPLGDCNYPGVTGGYGI